MCGASTKTESAARWPPHISLLQTKCYSFLYTSVSLFLHNTKCACVFVQTSQSGTRRLQACSCGSSWRASQTPSGSLWRKPWRRRWAQVLARTIKHIHGVVGPRPSYRRPDSSTASTTNSLPLTYRCGLVFVCLPGGRGGSLCEQQECRTPCVKGSFFPQSAGFATVEGAAEASTHTTC